MKKTTLDIELRSEEVQEILEAVPNWMIRWGNALILILIVCLLIMSWFIKYPDVINGYATLTTDTPPLKVYAKISAKIDTIFIDDNTLVNPNTTLAILENTANYKDVLFLKSIADTIKVSNSSFEFPIQKLPILFLGDIESDFAVFENNYYQYYLNKTLQPFSNETLANQNIKSELNSRLSTLLSQKRLNEKELSFQKADLDRHTTLFNKGVISKQAYEAKKLAYLQAERNFANIDALISQIREAISNANKVTKNTSINKTREETKLLKNTIQAFNQLKRAIKTWEMNYNIKSDIEGRVAYAKPWKANQIVNQGDLVFTIIPEENSSYIAQLNTPSQNSGKLKIGQHVNLKLENYPDTEFGVLQAKVNSISVLPDENGSYLITAKLPDKLVTTYNKTIDFKYEMRASAEIITEDLRLIERFFYQFKNILGN